MSSRSGVGNDGNSGGNYNLSFVGHDLAIGAHDTVARARDEAATGPLTLVGSGALLLAEAFPAFRDTFARSAAHAAQAQEVLKHVARLWGFGVQLESANAKGDITKRWAVPAPSH